MRRDSVGAGLDRDLRRAHGIRVMPTTGVTNGGDVIDIDAKGEVRSGHFSPSQLAPGICLPALDTGFVRNRRRQARRQAFTRSAFATTSFARNCAMMELRCLISNTSRSMVTDVKSGDDRSMPMLSMLPSC